MGAKKSWISFLKKVRVEAEWEHHYELLVDSVMGFIIIINALFIGISMDMKTSDSQGIFQVFERLFLMLFLFELLLKIRMNGVRGHFGTFSNIFDTSLVAIDVVTFLLEEFKLSVQKGNASMFRIVRLAKLTRVLRLLRSPIFTDLLCMIQGMIGGMVTLLWSMVLYVIVIYIAALIFRDSIGNSDNDAVREVFDSVPRAPYTMFRCSFGDCSTTGGTPIFEHVQLHHGTGWSVLYCLFTFTTTIGIFNVISAIFVESTMEAAKGLADRKKKQRLEDKDRWSICMTTFIGHIVQHMGISGEKLSEHVEEVYAMDVPLHVIDEVCKEQAVIDALVNLDIEEDGVEQLSDIMDPDNGGTIRIIEILEVIRRLRGDPRRSDTVCIDLMLRSMQHEIAKMDEKLNRRHDYNPSGEVVSSVPRAS